MKKSNTKETFWKRNKYLIAIWTVIILSFCLRYWGIDCVAYSDENNFLSRVFFMVQKHDLNPQWFSWPSLYFYIVYITSSIYWLFTDSALNLLKFYPIARLTTVFFGTATVYLTYKIGEKVFGRRTGLLSALTLGVTFIHVVTSHYATIDIPMTFFSMLGIIFALKIVERGNFIDYLLTGLFIGLANSTKYNYPLIIILIVAHVVGRWKGKNEGVLYKIKQLVKVMISKYLFIGCLLIFVGFFIGTPYALFDYHTFLYGAKNAPEPEGFLTMFNYVNSNRAIFASNSDGVPTWWWWIQYLFFSGLYYPTFLASIFGIFLIIWKYKNRKSFLLFIWFFVYVATLFRLTIRFDRYILPVIPIFAIFSGVFINYFLVLIKTREIYSRVIIISVFMLIFIGIPLGRSSLFDYLISSMDTRVLAGYWVKYNISKDSHINTVGMGIGIGQYLQLNGFTKVINSIDFKPKDIFKQHNGELLIIGSDLYTTAYNYRNSSPYKEYWENYKYLKENGELINRFSNIFFDIGLFSPKFLEHGSTVNTYHFPTMEIYVIPELKE